MTQDPNIVIENELLRHGFTSVPNYIFGLPISSNAKLVYMALLSYAWTNQSCYPGLEKLCRDVSLTDKPVTKAIHELSEVGVLDVKRRGQGKTNLYILKEFSSSIQNRKTSDSRIGGQNRKNSETRNGGSPNAESANYRKHGIRNEKHAEEQNTHTNERAKRVSERVGSRFLLEICRQYADHLKKTGQGIERPGGYATIIYRSGEADDLIEQFIQRQQSEKNDISKCPDCQGMGFVYPKGMEKGVVAKCKHPRLHTTLKVEQHIVQLTQMHQGDSSYQLMDLLEDLRFRCERDQINWDETVIKFLTRFESDNGTSP